MEDKTDSQYSPNLISSTRMRTLVTAAERLVREMEDLLRR